MAKKRETATHLITLHNVQVQIGSLFNLRFITYVTVMTIVISLILEYDHVITNTCWLAVKVNAILISVPEVNMILVGKYIFIFPVPACYNYFIIPNETNNTHMCKYCLQAYFNSIGTSSRIFKNHMQMMRSDCL